MTRSFGSKDAQINTESSGGMMPGSTANTEIFKFKYFMGKIFKGLNSLWEGSPTNMKPFEIKWEGLK